MSHVSACVISSLTGWLATYLTSCLITIKIPLSGWLSAPLMLLPPCSLCCSCTWCGELTIGCYVQFFINMMPAVFCISKSHMFIFIPGGFFRSVQISFLWKWEHLQGISVKLLRTSTSTPTRTDLQFSKAKGHWNLRTFFKEAFHCLHTKILVCTDMHVNVHLSEMNNNEAVILVSDYLRLYQNNFSIIDKSLLLSY